MGELNCIIDDELIKEKELLREDLYEGKTMEILILLLKGEKTAAEIGRSLNIPLFSVKLYIDRLLKFKLIKESERKDLENTVDNIYSLVTSKLDIIHRQKATGKKEDENRVKCEKMAAHFSKLNSHSIKNLYKYKDSPYTIKSCFISADPQRMSQFKERLEKLIHEFEELEEENQEATFSLMVNFAPFELTEDLKILG